MAWTYSSYITLSGSARLTALRLHIQEVSDRISDWQSQSTSGMSGSRYQLEKYLEGLMEQLQTLEGALGVNTSGTARTFTTRAKPI